MFIDLINYSPSESDCIKSSSLLAFGQTFRIVNNNLIIFVTNSFGLFVSWILKWLDWIFLGGYLPSLSINYVGVSKDMEKRLPQLYYIKMKISYDLGFIAIGVAMAT